VALLSIDGQAQRLRVVGEARDMDAVVAWLGGLRSSPWIAAADLSGHEQRLDGDIRVLRFSVDMRWKMPQ
jgi:Tfp pilus assembly protein PilN